MNNSSMVQLKQFLQYFQTLNIYMLLNSPEICFGFFFFLQNLFFKMQYTALLSQKILFFKYCLNGGSLDLENQQNMQIKEIKDSVFSVTLGLFMRYMHHTKFICDFLLTSSSSPAPCTQLASEAQVGFTAVSCAQPSMAGSSKTGHVTH